MNKKQFINVVLSGLVCTVSFVAAAAGIDNAAVNNTALAEHNNYRSTHHSPNMSLSNPLSATAKQWAEHIAATGEFKHSSSAQRNGAGENLYASFTTANSMPADGLVKKTVEGWYNEVKDYNYANPGFSPATGHFTQVVWKASTQLGCGAAKGTKNQLNAYYVVCHYAPAGNVVGQFPANVLQP